MHIAPVDSILYMMKAIAAWLALVPTSEGSHETLTIHHQSFLKYSMQLYSKNFRTNFTEGFKQNPPAPKLLGQKKAHTKWAKIDRHTPIVVSKII